MNVVTMLFTALVTSVFCAWPIFSPKKVAAKPCSACAKDSLADGAAA